MVEPTDPIRAWQGEFGKEYTDRNTLSVEEMDALYQRNYGRTRTEMNEAFVGSLDRSIRILEVGSNVGNQLRCLQHMGFRTLYGIELQTYAVEKAKATSTNINIIQGSAFDIPFKDDFFDLVFTSGVLIHIAPSDIGAVLREICRCSQRSIWGFEYFAAEHTGVTYRGREELLWKADFARLYQEEHPDRLVMLKEERYKYTDNDNVDAMFLLQKSSF